MRPIDNSNLNNLNQKYRKHIGHRIVTTALQFESRPQTLFQRNPLRTQNRKTDAESVDDITAANSMDSNNPN